MIISHSRQKRQLLSVFHKTNDVALLAFPLAWDRFPVLKQNRIPAAIQIDDQSSNAILNVVLCRQHHKVRRGQLLVVILVDMWFIIDGTQVNRFSAIVGIRYFIVRQHELDVNLSG